MKIVLRFDHPWVDREFRSSDTKGRTWLAKCESWPSEQIFGTTIIHCESEEEFGVQGSLSVLYADENQMLYGENNLFCGTSKNVQGTRILHATYLNMYYNKDELSDLAYLW
jgi:hypothetical protein